MINLTEAQKVLNNKSAEMGDVLRYSTCVKECPTEGKPVECKEPNFMKGNDNYAYEKCTYSIIVDYKDALG